MSELTKPVGPVGGGAVITAIETTPTVRELLTELASLEDAMRAPSGSRRDRRAALARQQEIIDELHRRCPEAETRADQPLL